MTKSSESSQPTISSSESRRRFYIVGPDLARNPSDAKFANKDTTLVDGCWIGKHNFPAPGYRVPFNMGIPAMREKPRLVVAPSRRKPIDIYGFGNPHFVSSRAKELLQSIDPDAFEFAECDTVNAGGKPIKPYWMMAVIRAVLGFDEERSDFLTLSQLYPEAEDQRDNPNISRLNDIYLPDGFPTDYHAFYFVRYQSYFIFDGTLVDAWREAKLTGALFTPLQPPTKVDRKDELSFWNRPFWSDRGSQS